MNKEQFATMVEELKLPKHIEEHWISQAEELVCLIKIFEQDFSTLVKKDFLSMSKVIPKEWCKESEDPNSYWISFLNTYITEATLRTIYFLQRLEVTYDDKNKTFKFKDDC